MPQLYSIASLLNIKGKNSLYRCRLILVLVFNQYVQAYKEAIMPLLIYSQYIFVTGF